MHCLTTGIKVSPVPGSGTQNPGEMIYDKRGGIKNMYQIHPNFGVKLSNLEHDLLSELPI